jgi:hypothetical protein
VKKPRFAGVFLWLHTTQSAAPLANDSPPKYRENPHDIKACRSSASCTQDKPTVFDLEME